MSNKFVVPLKLVNLTTTQRDAIVTPGSGWQIYNVTTNQIEYYNGSSWIGGSGLSTGTTIDAGLFGYSQGAIPANSRVMLQVQPTDITIPASSVGSVFHCITAPTSTVIFTIVKEIKNNYGTPNSMGTITFNANNDVGVLSFTLQQNVLDGDMIYIESPADTYGMQDLFMNLKGYGVIPVYV